MARWLPEWRSRALRLVHLKEAGMNTWFGPVLIGAGIVFLISLAGAYIEFNNRLVNAIVDAVLFLVVFGLIVYFGHYGVTATATP
jgi:hypothetical protein